jgi:predicted PurR-regulated permease PerM
MSAPSSPIPQNPVHREGIRRAGIAAWSIIGILILVAVFAWLLGQVRDIFPPIALAFILIFLLNPVVSRLEAKGIRRGLGTLTIYLLFILSVMLAVKLIVPPMGRQIHGLASRIPEIRDETLKTADQLLRKANLSLNDLGLSNATSGSKGAGAGSTTGSSTRNQTPSFIQNLGTTLFAGAGRFATGALHVVLNFILAPVLAAYLLIDLPKIQKAFIHYLPPRYRDEWVPLLERSGQAVGAFFRGQLLVALIVAAMSCVSFALIHLPFSLPIGLLAGFFNIIPLVGPFVGGALAVLVGAVTGGVALAVKAGLAMVLVQQIDNHFISPKVVGKAVRLHPVVVILALLAGATLGGLWGMLLAVPTVAVAKIVILYYYETRILLNPNYHLPVEEPAPPPRPRIKPRGPSATKKPPAPAGGSSGAPRPRPRRAATKPATKPPAKQPTIP